MEQSGSDVFTVSHEPWVSTPTKTEPVDSEDDVDSCGSAVTLRDVDIVFMWRSVKEGKGLTTDVNTARFLLSLYFNPSLEAEDTQSRSRCTHCHSSLTLCCVACLTSSRQPLPPFSSTPEVTWSQLQPPANDTDVESLTQDTHLPTSEDETEAYLLAGNKNLTQDTHLLTSEDEREADLLTGNKHEGDPEENTSKQIHRLPPSSVTPEKYPICDGVLLRDGHIPSKVCAEYKCSKCHKVYKHKRSFVHHMSHANCDSARDSVPEQDGLLLTRSSEKKSEKESEKESERDDDGDQTGSSCLTKPSNSAVTNVPGVLVQSFSGSTRYKCRKCNKIYKHKQSFNRHLNYRRCRFSPYQFPYEGRKLFLPDERTSEIDADATGMPSDTEQAAPQSVPPSINSPIILGPPAKDSPVWCSGCKKMYKHKQSFSRHLRRKRCRFPSLGPKVFYAVQNKAEKENENQGPSGGECVTDDNYAGASDQAPGSQTQQNLPDSNGEFKMEVASDDENEDTAEETSRLKMPKDLLTDKNRWNRAANALVPVVSLARCDSTLSSKQGSFQSPPVTEKYAICDGVHLQVGQIPHKKFSEYVCSRCNKKYRHRQSFIQHLRRPECDNSVSRPQLPGQWEFLAVGVTGEMDSAGYVDGNGVENSASNSTSLSASEDANGTAKREPASAPVAKEEETGPVTDSAQMEDYKCSECGKWYKHKNSFMRHYKNHLNHPECRVTGEMFRIQRQRLSQKTDGTGLPDSKQLMDSSHVSVGSSVAVCTVEEFMMGKIQIKTSFYQGPNSAMVKCFSHYTCDTCYKVFVSEEEYESHCQKHQDTGADGLEIEAEQKGPDPESLQILMEIKKCLLFCCPHCNQVFTHQKEHRQHVNSHKFTQEADGSYRCKLCGEPHQALLSLMGHQIMREDMKVCRHCGLRFVSLCQIKEHMETHGDGEKCETCGESFECLSKADIKKHLRSHKSCLCSICGKAVSAKGLYIHMFSHTDKRPFPCTKCGKRFKNKLYLDSHMKTHAKAFQCETCGAYFALAANLKAHRAVRHEGKFVECKECGKRLARNVSLLKHIRQVHRKNKPFTCSYCGLGCSDGQKLSQHTRIHTGEKPFQCQYCPSRFSDIKYLKQHVRTHTGEKPFGCEDCGMKFACRTSLMLHRKNRHKDALLSCTECGQKFPLQSSLDFHQFNMHGAKYPSMIDSGREKLKNPV